MSILKFVGPLVERESVPDQSLPVPVNPLVARAALLAHRDAALENLSWEEETDLSLYVNFTAKKADGFVDDYVARFRFTYYPDWPPCVTFVNPSSKEYDPAFWPKIKDSDRMALHPVYADSPTGLICNSMFFEYYFWGGHSRVSGQSWEKGLHTMAATVSELRLHLSELHYDGRQQ